MTKEQRMKYVRQSEIINMDKLRESSVTIIGVGSVGSFTSTVIGKMGVGKVVVYDEDGVNIHNLPGQFFREQDIGQFKVDALGEIMEQFSSDTTIQTLNRFYEDQLLQETVIVCTDTMESRRNIWNQFLKQDQAKNLIEIRMGAEMGKIYTIKDKSEETRDFYEKTLHSDAQSFKLPCTAKTIIYNVLMIAAWILRAYKSIIQDEKIPKEIIFNLTRIDITSLMLRDE